MGGILRPSRYWLFLETAKNSAPTLVWYDYGSHFAKTYALTAMEDNIVVNLYPRRDGVFRRDRPKDWTFSSVRSDTQLRGLILV